MAEALLDRSHNEKGLLFLQKVIVTFPMGFMLHQLLLITFISICLFS